MDRVPSKSAALLAFVIGVMALFAGGKVLIGIDPGYFVINWLPLYNYTVGMISVLLLAPALWSGRRSGTWLAFATLAAHALVFLVIRTTYAPVVADESIKAMIVRMVAGIVIAALALLGARHKPSVSKEIV